MFLEMDEVDLVFGNIEKLECKFYVDVVVFGIFEMEKVCVNDIMSVEEIVGYLIDGFIGWVCVFV